MKSLYDILCLFILPVRAIWSSIKLFVFATYIQDQNVIHGYILILNCFHLIWKIHNSIGRNLILKYCPRITFVIIWFQIMSFLIGWRPLVTFFDNINILPLVEGVMVDYHTRGEISQSGKRIPPETKSKVIFFFQSVIFFPESVNQWDTLCTYHYLNKAATTIISTSNIFINNNRKKCQQ